MRSRSRKWLYLPIETKVREQDAKLLLAYHAVNHGYHVVIGEHRMVEQAAEKLPGRYFPCQRLSERVCPESGGILKEISS